MALADRSHSVCYKGRSSSIVWSQHNGHEIVTDLLTIFLNAERGGDPIIIAFVKTIREIVHGQLEGNMLSIGIRI